MRYGIFCVALLAFGCAPSVQPVTPTSQAAHGAPARVELSSSPGTGIAGGTATISARVLDAYATVLAGQAVTFTTSVGTLAQTSVITNDQGLARTILTAPAGNAQVTARAGSIETTPLVVAVQPLVTPPTPEPNPPSPNPNPNPAPPPTGPLTVTLLYTPGPAGTPTTFALALAGGLSSAQWTFGDGTTVTTNLPSTAHVYTAPGTYVASVTVRDQAGRTANDTRMLTIAPAPVPTPTPAPVPNPPRYDIDISLNPSASPQHNSPIQVIASINGQFTPPPIESITFNCGGLGAVDPPPSLSTTAACTYNRTGTVTAQVTVTGGAITSTASKTFVVY